MKMKAYQILNKLGLFNRWARIGCFLFLSFLIFVFFKFFIFDVLLEHKKNYLIFLNNARSEISKNNSKNENLLKKRDIYDRLKKTENKNPADIFKFVDEAHKKNNVSLESIKPVLKEPHKEAAYNVDISTYKIIMSGNYINLIGFLKEISGMPMLISFAEISLESIEEAPENYSVLRLSLEMNIYSAKK